MTQAAPTTPLERIQATSTPIIMPSALESGTLVRWFKKPGEQVERYEALAEVETDGVATELTSTTNGVVKALMVREGVSIVSGDVICYVRPPEPPALPASNGKGHLPRGSRVVAPKDPPAPSSNSRPMDTASSADGNGHSPSRSRRSMWDIAELPEVEELTLEAAEPRKPKQEAGPRRQTQKPKRGKTTHKTYHLEESQVQRIKRLSLELQLDEQAPLECNESELIRAAVEMLLELPRPALRAVLQANREREKAGQYGSGWPRPGRK